VVSALKKTSKVNTSLKVVIFKHVKTGPIYGMETNIKSGNGWFLNFMVLAIYQSILHLNKCGKKLYNSKHICDA
jgi:hypothetical protein